MKLGIFDSGLGGLHFSKVIRKTLPDLDLLYYGDTMRVPYGNRSDTAIYAFTKAALDEMFHRDCALVILACNTASAAALRRLQQDYLPRAWPGRNALGIVVPTLEAALDMNFTRLGLIATNYIINSGVYPEELGKLRGGEVDILPKATPLLVPLMENQGEKWLNGVLEDYLYPLLEADIDCLLLGCTHYVLLKERIRQIIGSGIPIIAQDDILPSSLEHYLDRHPEYADKIGRNGRCEFYVSDITPGYCEHACQIYGEDISIALMERAA